MNNQTGRHGVETESGQATDGQLLQQFVDRHDHEAFAALVQRYSGLVMGLCRRTLGDEHCAEDAFQATFLVLARKAPQIRTRTSLASWLYAVAYRTARRVQADRRKRREQALLDDMKDEHETLVSVGSRHDQLLLDEELQQLAAKYREPLVLRYLMGRSNQEVASELGLPLGVVEGRLKRAKDKLRQRLARRGISIGCAIAAVAASTSEMAAAESLVAATVDAAGAIATGAELPSGFSEGAIRLCEQELMMKTSTLISTAASVSAIALVVAGLAIAQTAGAGARTTRAAEPALTVAPAMQSNQDLLVFTTTAVPTAANMSNLPGAEKIEAALAQKGDSVLQEVPLMQVVDQIAEEYGINVVIDDRALDDVGIERDVPLTVDLSDLPLTSRLTLMLKNLDLTWTINEGVLLITTPEAEEQLLITRTYEVGDLIGFQTKEGEDWTDYDGLIEVITSTIQPETWEEVGGAGSIEAAPFGNAEMIVVAQTYHIHKEIEQLLKDLRSFSKPTGQDGRVIREKPPAWSQTMQPQMGGAGGFGGGPGGGTDGSGLGGGGGLGGGN